MFSRFVLKSLRAHPFINISKPNSMNKIPRIDYIFNSHAKSVTKYINTKTIKYTLITTFIVSMIYEYNPYNTQIAVSYDQNPQNQEIVKSLHSLYNQHFYPSILCINGLLQVIMACLIKHTVVYQREPIMLPDGGQIVLDWALPQKQIEYTGTALSGRYYPYEPSKDNKILLVLHGLTGGSENGYVQSLVEEGSKRGYRVVVLNQRGINQPLSSPKTFHGGLTDDMAIGIDHIRKSYPDAPILAIGTSFGANLLLRYLGEIENKKNIQGAVLLSPPFSSDDVADRIEGTIFETFLLKSFFEQSILPNFDMLKSLEETHGIDLEEVLKQTNIREFHKSFTMKMYELQDIGEYFSTMTIRDSHIKGIEVPMLVIHAKDDPICAHKSVPIDTLVKNPNIIMAETSRGGHLGWITGLIPRRWYAQPTLEFLDKVTEMIEKEKKRESSDGVYQLEDDKPEEMQPAKNETGQFVFY